MPTSFGTTLTELREMRGLKRSQLAYKAQLGSSTIRMLELRKRSDPRSSTLAKLSDALNVSADDILIKAGMKAAKPTGNPGILGPKEKEIIKCIRAIESPAFRQHVLETILMFAKGAQEADYSYEK